LQWLIHTQGQHSVLRPNNKDNFSIDVKVDRCKCYSRFLFYLTSFGSVDLMFVNTLYGAIDYSEFKREYIDKRLPVIVKGYGSNWAAVKNWNLDYFKNRFGEKVIITKKFLENGEILKERPLLCDYITHLNNYEDLLGLGMPAPKPAYWHDVPIFQMFKDLSEDVSPFPVELLPSFYRKGWSRYIQFFLGASGSTTKLHFDTLRTHNLTFQIAGRKKWTILSSAEEKLCGRKKWRWFGVDPESPDYDRFPEYKNANPVSIVVEPGDLLYIPPGTLHHVKSLSSCISFNVDFHTRSSVINSFLYIYKGMPLKVFYYNIVLFLGLVFKIPSKFLFYFYRSYLNYVS
jgi:hypothetical protein